MVFKAKTESINDFINSGKSMNRCFLINILLNFFRLFYLPWNLFKPRDNGVYFVPVPSNSFAGFLQSA